jgi:cold shock CspA family protein
MSSEAGQYLGRVKWFNSRAGYGFISALEASSDLPEEIFVHQSHLKTGKEQYRYLVEGEYVSFSVAESEGEHARHAADVTGVKGGKLMCETRSDIKSRAPPKDSGAAPSKSDAEGDSEWSVQGKRAGGSRKGKSARGGKRTTS